MMSVGLSEPFWYASSAGRCAILSCTQVDIGQFKQSKTWWKYLLLYESNSNLFWILQRTNQTYSTWNARMCGIQFPAFVVDWNLHNLTFVRVQADKFQLHTEVTGHKTLHYTKYGILDSLQRSLWVTTIPSSILKLSSQNLHLDWFDDRYHAPDVPLASVAGST